MQVRAGGRTGERYYENAVESDYFSGVVGEEDGVGETREKGADRSDDNSIRRRCNGTYIE